MNLAELEKQIERARLIVEDDPTLAKSHLVYKDLQEMSQSLIDMHCYYERWRKSMPECPRSGKTGPCTYQTGQEKGMRKCFYCGDLHPEDARAATFNANTIIEELIDHRDEAKKLATMLYEGAATPETQWVKVLADAIIGHLAATEVK